MNLLLTSSLLLLLLSSLASVSFACLDARFRCPAARSPNINTCNWKRSAFLFQALKTAMQRNGCHQYSCAGSVDKWYKFNDGCNGPTGINGEFGKVFRAACGIHDLCYATPGRTQWQCDNDFRYNMVETCKEPLQHGGYGTQWCNGEARKAYTAVRTRGKPYFDRAQKAFCKRV